MTKLGGVPVTEEEKAMILKERQEVETQYQVGAYVAMCSSCLLLADYTIYMYMCTL